MQRTDYCGAFREKDIGREVTAMGWVQAKRDMGGVIFVDLRDRAGILQVVCDANILAAQDFSAAGGLRGETVASFKGLIRERSEETKNPKLATGAVELAATAFEVICAAEPLPFQMEDAGNVRESLRLRYRFIDLRRPLMFERLRLRHRVVRAAEDFLDRSGFLSVETPMLTKSTPEGARDYLVPSRVHARNFYALPQSPQIFKQLLMIGGIDRYYQVARCFRDEDLRADRQPEFTQVDMELSFVEQEDILHLLEQLFKHLFSEVLCVTIPGAFPRLTWTQAMDRYGSDKPDLRFDLAIVDVTPLAAQCAFSVFKDAAAAGGAVRAINVKGGASFTRGFIDELTEMAVGHGAKGMAWIALRQDGKVQSVLTKYFPDPAVWAALLSAVEAVPGDFILFCADTLPVVRSVLGALRLELAARCNLCKGSDFRFLFVTDFPQFEYSGDEKRFVAAHHPFTMPEPEDVAYLLSDPGRVRAQAFDVVLNGVELGSGSMRIHRRDIQQKMFEALGLSHQEIQDRFGFLLEAFSYGAPPHGGFAFGLDRLVMLMAGADSLRDVIAFPKLGDGSCPLTGAPDTVDGSQLQVLGLCAGEETRAVHDRPAHAAPRIDVANVARLSKLTLSAEEARNMTSEMEEMIAFADRLTAIPTDSLPVLSHHAGLENVFRDDEVGTPLDRAALLGQAPRQEGGCFFVPQVAALGRKGQDDTACEDPPRTGKQRAKTEIDEGGRSE